MFGHSPRVDPGGPHEFADPFGQADLDHGVDYDPSVKTCIPKKLRF